MLTVSALHIYPIKSCRGLDLTAVRLDRLGPLYDRRFMLVDEAGRFLTQRELPRMALIAPRLGPTALQVSAPEMPMLKVAMSQPGAKRIAIQIWQQQGEAEDAGEHASSWFSQFLERRCRLVRLPADSGRPVDPAYAGPDARVAFSDGFPLLLTTEASLADINGRMERALPMNRFRPNIVVRGGEPYAEDRWKRIRVGGAVARVVQAVRALLDHHGRSDHGASRQRAARHPGPVPQARQQGDVRAQLSARRTGCDPGRRSGGSARRTLKTSSSACSYTCSSS